MERHEMSIGRREKRSPLAPGPSPLSSASINEDRHIQEDREETEILSSESFRRKSIRHLVLLGLVSPPTLLLDSSQSCCKCLNMVPDREYINESKLWN
jgi:hypothetical protein